MKNKNTSSLPATTVHTNTFTLLRNKKKNSKNTPKNTKKKRKWNNNFMKSLALLLNLARRVW